MANGKVKWYDERKGYGFIEASDGSELFVHHSGILNKQTTRLETGQRVSFDEVEGKKGPKAVNVTPEE